MGWCLNQVDHIILLVSKDIKIARVNPFSFSECRIPYLLAKQTQDYDRQSKRFLNIIIVIFTSILNTINVLAEKGFE